MFGSGAYELKVKSTLNLTDDTMIVVIKVMATGILVTSNDMMVTMKAPVIMVLILN